MNLKQSLEKHDFHGVWMRLLALAMILIVAVSALIASPVSANAAEVGDPSAVKGKTYAVGTDTTFAPFEYRENGKMTGIDYDHCKGCGICVHECRFDALKMIPESAVEGGNHA